MAGCGRRVEWWGGRVGGGGGVGGVGESADLRCVQAHHSTRQAWFEDLDSEVSRVEHNLGSSPGRIFPREWRNLMSNFKSESENTFKSA